ncbi:MAG TPA: hypothetical protein VK501_10945 [Baekduia sp.]|uniref:hypothetical protein n=1 Tax=Baekduia sp. TaxID=2600305 RepID=UPI002BAAA3ED|nr:hypothetical protein [Baekduia sp.]HMJ34423.1 hypothetical protein [Baekduia sp.]
MIGPRQLPKDTHEAGRAYAAGLGARVAGHLRAHSAAYAVAVAVASVAWGLEQVG